MMKRRRFMDYYRKTPIFCECFRYVESKEGASLLFNYRQFKCDVL